MTLDKSGNFKARRNARRQVSREERIYAGFRESDDGRKLERGVTLREEPNLGSNEGQVAARTKKKTKKTKRKISNWRQRGPTKKENEEQ